MIKKEIIEELLRIQDIKYRDFQAKLIPTVKPEAVIGVRTPELRKYAGQLVNREEINEFLDDLPHAYFDENQLHAFIISKIRDYDRCIKEVDRFLPYVDNWATCDQLSPVIFRKNRDRLIGQIKKWIGSDATYTKRFGIGMLMQHYLDEDYRTEYSDIVASVRSEEYYVNMMIAWYFATALAKQYDEVLPYITERRLDTWTHNKAIQKAVESYRISPSQKEFLKSLKIKK